MDLLRARSLCQINTDTDANQFSQCLFSFLLLGCYLDLVIKLEWANSLFCFVGHEMVMGGFAIDRVIRTQQLMGVNSLERHRFGS